MRKSRSSEEQIIKILKEKEAGAKLADLCRRHGISEQTFHRWKAKFGGMEVNDARRLKQLEDENRRLKHLVADLTLDNQALKAITAKSGDAHGATPSRGRTATGVWHERTTGLSSDRVGALDVSASATGPGGRGAAGAALARWLRSRRGLATGVCTCCCVGKAS
jgi:putative transposase